MQGFPNSIWIVVINYNGLADTQRCLRSLARARGQHCSLVVVDNASSQDPTGPLQKEFPWCHVIRTRQNLGWAGGNNVGIRYALQHNASFVALLNNDTVVSHVLFDRLLDAARAYPGYGIIGPVIRSLESPHDVMTDGCVFNRRQKDGFFAREEVALNQAAMPVITDVDIVNGCCIMVASPVFKKIGLIDERFFLVHEESDFCLRALRSGFRCGVIDQALVWHKGSGSFKRTGKSLQRYYDARNLLLLLFKHAGSKAQQRPLASSLWQYCRYVYHRYSIECENGHLDTAAAVIEGMVDGLFMRFGAKAAIPLIWTRVGCSILDQLQSCRA